MLYPGRRRSERTRCKHGKSQSSVYGPRRCSWVVQEEGQWNARCVEFDKPKTVRGLIKSLDCELNHLRRKAAACSCWAEDEKIEEEELTPHGCTVILVSTVRSEESVKVRIAC